MREKARIRRFLARRFIQQISLVIPSLIGAVIRVVAVTLALLAICLGINDFVAPRIYHWFGDHFILPTIALQLRPNDASTWGNFFTTIVAIAAGVMAILVAASMVLIDSISSRYPASAIVYLAREHTRTNLLSLLLITLSFSLANLLLRGVGLANVIVAMALYSGTVGLQHYDSPVSWVRRNPSRHPRCLEVRYAPENPPRLSHR